MSARPGGPLEPLRTQIAGLPVRLHGRGDILLGNRMALRLQGWARYAYFLEHILRRYDAASDQYRMMPDPAPPEHWEELQIREYEVHLEIESFYVFASIFLDRVADLIAYCFGLSPGDFGSSHSRLVARLGDVAREYPLERTRRLKGLADDLKEKIFKPRNKMVEHLTDPGRTRAITTHPASGALVLSATRRANPERGDEEPYHSSGDLHALLSALGEYAVEALEFLEANVGRFRIREELA